MIHSMTGFGRAQRDLDGLALAIELQSVNRRNLEISVNLPRDWQLLERELQAPLREELHRGKVHLTVQVSMAAGEEGFRWDEPALQASLRRLEALAQKEGVAWEPDADLLVRLAALHKTEMALPGAEEILPVLRELLSEAMASFVAMRASEGTALAEDMAERIGSLRTALEAIRAASEGTADRYREMLLQRLRQTGLDLDLTDERVLKEVALFADKCDISEELIRVESHLTQFRDCLTTGSPIGRKLEFIVQELNREFNTIGSKVGNVEASRHVIEAKNEIERIREQIQNIE